MCKFQKIQQNFANKGISCDFDKKGEAAQVYDVIWNPKSIERCKTDAPFRQIVVELAFNHIYQKHQHQLDLRFTIPKMKYKGSSVQYQRVRAKKGPKIQEMEISEEEKQRIEAKSLEHQKRNMLVQEVVETIPEWQMYCALTKDEEVLRRFGTSEFWERLVEELLKRSDETGIGDSQDRQDTLAAQFRLPVTEDVLEDFDGVNHEEANKLIFVVALPVIMRGHAIQVKVNEEALSVRVPNLYNLQLGLPIPISANKTSAYFDSKLRKLFVVLPKRQEEAVQEEAEVEQVIQIVDTKKLENDMLFDIV